MGRLHRTASVLVKADVGVALVCVADGRVLLNRLRFDDAMYATTESLGAVYLCASQRADITVSGLPGLLSCLF